MYVASVGGRNMPQPHDIRFHYSCILMAMYSQPRGSQRGRTLLNGDAPRTSVALTVIIGLLLVTVIVPGCTTLVPKSTAAYPRQNGITEYHTPTFTRKIAWPGWLFIGGATAAGTWAGYKSGIALRWTGWDRRSEIQPAGNAVLGALTGLASSALLTLIVGGDAPTVNADNAELWLDKQDDRLLLLPVDSLHPGLPMYSVFGIARAADASYTIGSMYDARLYLVMFPDSPHRDRVLAEGLPHLQRDSLPALAQLARGLPVERMAVERYVAGISSIEEATNALARFPEYPDIIERRTAGLVNSVSLLRQYARLFPTGANLNSVAARIGDRLHREEIPGFLAAFPGADNQLELQRRYLLSGTTVSDAIESAHRFPDIRAEADRRASELAQSAADFRAYLDAFPEGMAAGSIAERLRQARLVDPQRRPYRYETTKDDSDTATPEPGDTVPSDYNDTDSGTTSDE